jgi:hypothetical protein
MMRLCLAGAVAILGVGLVASGPAQPPVTYPVARVVDGDTLTLANGERVRLVQIDTPEVGTGECTRVPHGRRSSFACPSAAVSGSSPTPASTRSIGTGACCGTSGAGR